MILQLPRAPAGETVALDATFFNRLMDIVAAQANFTATPPLFLNEGPHGRTLSIVQAAIAAAGNNIVNLSQTGGSAGANPANWTYTAADVSSGATLGTVLTPSFRESGTRSSATKGLGYTVAGTFTLVFAFEKWVAGSDYMVQQWQGGVLVKDWVRAH